MAIELIEPKEFPYLNYKRYNFSLGIRAKDFVFLSGQTASEYDPQVRRVVCRGRLEEQTRKIHEKLKLILNAAGVGFEDVLKLTDYVSPNVAENTDTIDRVRREYFTSPEILPVCSRIFVDGLIRGDALLEVECIAIIGKERRRENSSQTSMIGYPVATRKGSAIFFSEDLRASRVNFVVGIKQGYSNLDKILNQVGAKLSEIVSVNEFVCSDSPGIYTHDFLEMNSARSAVFGPQVPATLCIGIRKLGETQATAELSGIAVVGDRKNIVREEDPTSSCFAVEKDGFIFLSCLSAETGEADSMAKGTIVYQTRHIFEKMQKALSELHANIGNIVKTSDFFLQSGIESYKGTGQVREEVFSHRFPASSGVIVGVLSKPKAQIALSAVAAK